MNLALVDTHCHLDARQFAGEATAAILARAAAAGVTRVVTIATDLASSRRAIDLAGREAAVWATVGVDPNDAAGFDDRVLAEVAALAGAPKVVAIGEIGLDYYWNRAPREVQARAFQAQLDLARRAALPVVIHNRDADADSAAMLLAWAAEVRRDRSRSGSREDGEVGRRDASEVEEQGADRREEAGAQVQRGSGGDGDPEVRPVDRPLGVMHCYSGDLVLARELVDAGFLISLAGPVTYKNASATQAVAAGLPESALVLETDAPYLSPVPYRGQRNEPARVRRIAEFVAELRGTSLEAFARATSANAARLFGWEAPETWPSR